MNAPDDYNSDPPNGDMPDLGADLQRHYGHRIEVPQDIDDRMSAAIAEQWAPTTSRPIRWRRATAYSGVAAALLITAIWMNLPRRPAPAPQMVEARRAAPADIDGDGNVNILDAYQLARSLGSGRLPGPGSPGWHDVNDDGAMNRLDVDAVAYRAVRLEGSPG